MRINLLALGFPCKKFSSLFVEVLRVKAWVELTSIFTSFHQQLQLTSSSSSSSSPFLVYMAYFIELSALLLTLLLSPAHSSFIVYNTSQGVLPGKLNVHLVAHTHDDVGWLKTVDQYYVGSNNSIQGACVQNVLDSLIPALLADRNRKFIYVEQAFFQRWWRQQSKTMQSVVKKLVNSGQLEFINGGMCMHDEASPHYIDMIDQTTLGHRYIKEQFGVTPRIGWQIDPFGHAAVQAYLLGAEVGFDSVFFGRIDYQDREKRKNEKSLEVVWRGSKSLGSSAQIFAGAFPKNYEPPPGGFYFEVNDPSPVIQDDINLFDYNVQERVNDFVSAAMSQANITRTNHIMWTMGTDFKYQYANSWFRQMDKFIHYVNLDGRVNALYSTPSIYTDAKHEANESWPLKSEDYFPYADRPNGYWTGYFSSRPSLKRFVRTLSGYLMAARQLEFFIGKSKTGPTTDSLSDALAIAQHHDAVSGTEKQHVANDYATRLWIGYEEAANLVAKALTRLVESKSRVGRGTTTPNFLQCPLLNISYCPPTEIQLSPRKNLIVVAYNSLGWKREDIIRIPVSEENLIVRDSDGEKIESQLLPFVSAHIELRNFHSKAYLGKTSSETPKYWLAFGVSVPPLGFSTYSISSSSKDSSANKSSESTYYTNESSMFEVGHGNLKLKFPRNNGKPTQYINSRTSVDEYLEQSYTHYAGAIYDKTEENPQAAGAYIFRPNGTTLIKPQEPVHLKVLRGSIVDEVHQKINPWIYQINRLQKGKEHVEVEFIVGPIPIDDGIGKEVVTKISMEMQTNKTFYTDSSGRDFIKRIRDYRTDWNLDVNQPIAGNYYPINLGIYMEDKEHELSILVDRALGGSSIEDGQVELMLHRRLLHDDARGVDEALNETVCVSNECTGLIVQGKYYLRIDPLGEGAEWRRSFGQEIYSPLLLAFAEQDQDNWMRSPTVTFSGFKGSYTLPKNVAVITLEELSDGKVLLRLAHLYEVGEDEDLSVVTEVKLKKLFYKEISKVTETSLSANQERAEMEKKRLVWKVEGSSKEEPKVVRGAPVDPSELIVQLAPMEIRTFIVEFYSAPTFHPTL
uniref:Alpha-mannosidase n=1 Tax=Kalanchoe fedtschenkoi TaxID=63787 RepID=A0A7N0UN86_KALFE